MSGQQGYGQGFGGGAFNPGMGLQAQGQPLSAGGYGQVMPSYGMGLQNPQGGPPPTDPMMGGMQPMSQMEPGKSPPGLIGGVPGPTTQPPVPGGTLGGVGQPGVVGTGSAGGFMQGPPGMGLQTGQYPPNPYQRFLGGFQGGGGFQSR